jgi:hypothetical protein
MWGESELAIQALMQVGEAWVVVEVVEELQRPRYRAPGLWRHQTARRLRLTHRSVSLAQLLGVAVVVVGELQTLVLHLIMFRAVAYILRAREVVQVELQEQAEPLVVHQSLPRSVTMLRSDVIKLTARNWGNRWRRLIVILFLLLRSLLS